MTIVNDDSSVVSKWSFKLIDNPKVVIYDHHRFVTQGTPQDKSPCFKIKLDAKYWTKSWLDTKRIWICQLMPQSQLLKWCSQQPQHNMLLNAFRTHYCFLHWLYLHIIMYRRCLAMQLHNPIPKGIFPVEYSFAIISSVSGNISHCIRL